ncbi:class I SAM-dependent methyltransferase [Candidatus Micrarchaeota archaeon]|jgi:SAM-dependent methyltransferase|nr:class I SAM-dependent methyltransferase [Candidatus Micrarchaeota archaeon]
MQKLKKILEIGTGLRFPVYECLIETKQISNSFYVGIDIDPQILKRARILLDNPDKFPNFSFVCADILAPYPPFEENIFDIIHCHMITIKNGFDEENKYPKLIKKIYKLLKYGGEFYISADHNIFNTKSEDYGGLDDLLKNTFSELNSHMGVPFTNKFSNWSMFSKYYAYCKK